MSDRRLAKITDLRELPIVEVLWKDATSFHGWDSLQGARKDTPAECRVVGRLIRHDRKFVSVAQAVNADGKLCENWVIPRPWVLRIAVIKSRSRRASTKRRRP